MLANAKLVSIGSFDLKLNHLLIIGVLSLSFSISLLLRSQPADYGFELNEFDPFFNYRATQYMVDNGIASYFEWNDDLSWYPTGRDVSASSQVILHLSAAVTYWIFGGGMDLYDFTILFPAIFGSFSAIVIFALVRVIGGTTAGLFSALLFSVSLSLLIRGPIGWFKSEPLGLFFGLLAVYLLLSGISSGNKKIAFGKLVGAGIFTAFSLSAWGGNQFFIIPIGIFFLALPFLRTDHKFILWAIPLYTIATVVVSLGFERVSSNFIFGLGGISLVFPALFLVACIFIQKKSKNHKTRNGLLFLFALLIIAPGILLINFDSEFLPLPSHRYLNALNPFLTTTDPLVDSVSEHATTTLSQSFLFNSVLMVFAGLGVWLVIKSIQNKNFTFFKNDLLVFSLIMGIGGVYVSATFVRLEVFASISLIVLASLGLAILAKNLFKNSSNVSFTSKFIQLPYIAGIVILLMIPMVYPVGSETTTLSNASPTILNGGSVYQIATNDWLDTLDWIKNNTPEDSVIVSWWDYGYWISTMSDRATLADNSTTYTHIIENIARIFLGTPDDAWHSLNDVQADYVVVFVVGEKLDLGDSPDSLYSLVGGGDESKKQWFIKIAGYESSKYLYPDGLSGTDYFWDETLLGQMFPFSLLAYVNPSNTSEQSPTYAPGLVGVYEKDIKFPSDGDGPLRLVYASPSFTEEKVGPLLGVFVYEINKDYNPEQSSSELS